MWQFVHRNRQRVVIVGGNFAGLSAASKLSRRFDVTVIDPLQNFEWTPNIHEILSGVKSENGLLLSRSKILQRLGHQFLQDSVSNISIEDNLVHTQAGIQLPYDYCVVATGGERQTYGAAGAEDIPLLTTASAALAAAKGLHEWKNSSLEVRTLQAYHEGVKAEH